MDITNCCVSSFSDAKPLLQLTFSCCLFHSVVYLVTKKHAQMTDLAIEEFAALRYSGSISIYFVTFSQFSFTACGWILNRNRLFHFQSIKSNYTTVWLSLLGETSCLVVSWQIKQIRDSRELNQRAEVVCSFTVEVQIWGPKHEGDFHQFISVNLVLLV